MEKNKLTTLLLIAISCTYQFRPPLFMVTDIITKEKNIP